MAGGRGHYYLPLQIFRPASRSVVECYRSLQDSEMKNYNISLQKENFYRFEDVLVHSGLNSFLKEHAYFHASVFLRIIAKLIYNHTILEVYNTYSRVHNSPLFCLFMK